MEIVLDDGEGLYGVDARLSFDPTVVTVPLGAVTPIWEVLAPSFHFVVKNVVDNDAGTVW
ncbi:MAG: hypothetical protein GX605_00715 [Chloroflexi bacterium]|nr:hypothetical protein [Chloroflexota bacterium]